MTTQHTSTPAGQARPALRISIFIYGLLSYAIFFATFLYGAAFMGNLVPNSVDGQLIGNWWTALAVNAALLLLFALQHSIMARPAFKAAWTRVVHPAAERSTYVLFSSLALIALFWLWRPMGGVVWDLHATWARAVMWAVFAFGWLTILYTTFLINHFDLFGLRQVWLFLRGKEYTPLHFVMPGPYKLVRHPLYVGWLCAFWGAPTMTVSHLVFAIATTAYILIAIQLEERDLITTHPEYADYRRRVGMLWPRLAGRSSPTPSTPANA